MPRLAAAIARLALLAYPRDLRLEHGAEIGEVFAERLAGARAVGVRAAVALCARELIDSVAAGLGSRGGRRRRAFHLRPAQPPPYSPRERLRLAMDRLAQDIRYALRSFRANPGFTLMACVVLALGIGANTAMFSVVNAILLQPLPFTEPQRLVAIWETNPERNWRRAQVAAANYLDWREQATTFAGMAAHNDWLTEVALTGSGDPTVLRANAVTGNFFNVLGVRLERGAGFTAADDWSGGEATVVLSHALWQKRFGADPLIVGRAVVLDGSARTIVGVAPPGLRYPFANTDAWLPVRWDPEYREQVWFRRAHGMRVIGRLAEGVDERQAEQELATIAARLEQQYPETNVAMGTGLGSLHEWVVGDTRTPLLILLAAVGLVLLIACANVANMQLARATGRRTEMAVRGALGAPASRLLRQTLTESLMLSLLGGALGLAIGAVGTRWIAALAPAEFPRVHEVGLDITVLGFTFIVATVAGLVFGLAPARRAAATDLQATLAAGTRSSESRKSRRTAGLLVIAEIALVLPLAIGAGLMVRTLSALNRVDPGFVAADTTVFGLSLPDGTYADGAARGAFFRTLLEALRQRPSIDSAAVSTRLSFVNQRWSSDFRAESWPPDRYAVGVRHDEISLDLFRTMKVPMLAGRDFELGEIEQTPVAIVNRALVEAYFPDRNPVGERLCFDRKAEDCRFWYTVVGVVDNVRRESLSIEEKPSIYGSIYQSGSPGGFLLVRSDRSTEEVVAEVTAAVRQLDPTLPFHTVTTLAAVVGESVQRERLILTLLALFAAIATLLAALGVYGVVAYTTARRTREIGVRITLGASPSDVLGSVVHSGMLPVLLGIAFGLAVAGAVVRFLQGLVFGVGVADPITYGIVTIVLAGVALVACVLPARRALRVDPVEALRAE